MNRQIKRAIVKNTSVLMGMELGMRVLEVVTSIILARFLAPQGFGLMSFAFAFVSLFGLVAEGGMSVLVTRDVARDPSLRSRYLANGLMAKAKPYPLVIDTRIDSSAAAMMKDLADGEIDAGILFGPMAGYYAKQASAPTTVVPLTKEKGGPRLDFRTGMGVRFADQDWKRILNRLIEENQTDISRLLLSYGVPLLDDNGQLVTEATLAK